MDSLCNVSMYSDGIIVNSMKPEQDSKIWKKKNHLAVLFFLSEEMKKSFWRKKKEVKCYSPVNGLTQNDSVF